MAITIRCYTLFDITKTNVTHRRPPPDTSVEDLKIWQQKRNTQCNYDTVLQVISIRAQPENITEPIRRKPEVAHFGKRKDITQCWTFDFTIHYAQVFNDGKNDLGALFTDCENVPMIITDGIAIDSFLSTAPENSNIYFEIISNE